MYVLFILKTCFTTIAKGRFLACFAKAGKVILSTHMTEFSYSYFCVSYYTPSKQKKLLTGSSRHRVSLHCTDSEVRTAFYTAQQNNTAPLYVYCTSHSSILSKDSKLRTTQDSYGQSVRFHPQDGPTSTCKKHLAY